MPELEQLEKFNQDLINIGDEPAQAKRRGEDIERVMTPEEYPLNNVGSGVKTNKSTVSASNDEGQGQDDASAGTDDFLASLEPDLFESNDDESGGSPIDYGELGLGLDDEASSSAQPDDDASDLFEDDLLSTINAGLGDEDLEQDADATETKDDEASFLDGFSDDFLTGGQDALTEFDAELETEAEPEAKLETEPEAKLETDKILETDDLDSIENSQLGDLPDLDDDHFIGDLASSDDPDTELDLVLPDDSSPGAVDAGLDLGADFDELGLDDFETDADNEFHQAAQSFDADAIAGSQADAEAVSASSDEFPSMPDFGADMDADFSTDSFNDEFDMSDFGKDFGLMEEVKSEDWGKPGAGAKSDDNKLSVVSDAEEEIQKVSIQDEAEAFEISDKDFKYLQDSLSAMPLNLKIAAEEVLASETYSFEELRLLIGMLVRGDSPKDIASVVSRITGKKIKVPAGYQRKTGLAFEQEQKSFAYQFRHNIVPLLRVVSLSFVAAAVLFYAIYEFVYRPIYGASLYEQGLQAIRSGEFDSGNQFFKWAWIQWPDESRYVQYAQAFREMRADAKAREKFIELLGRPNVKDKPIGVNRLHRQGILQFADFLGYYRREYSLAVNYLQRLVDVNKFDHDPTIMQGDIFLEWARYTSSSSVFSIERNGRIESQKTVADLYEAARYNYASLISSEGQTDILLSRMLRYFMRTGNEDEVVKIKNLFLKDSEAKPDGNVTAELAGYLIDSAEGNFKIMDEAYKLILKSINGGYMEEPGLHYQLSRYSRFFKSQDEEEKALKWARTYYERLQEKRAFNQFERTQYIDTLIRDGERLYGPLYGNTDLLNAINVLTTARELYDSGLKASLLPEKTPLLGRVYARLGDVLYYDARDLPGALRQYRIARDHGYGNTPKEVGLGSAGLLSQGTHKRLFLPVGDAGVPHLSSVELIEAARDIAYKSGYVYYNLARVMRPRSVDQERNFDRAASEFIQAEGALVHRNINLQYAIANTHYLRANYDAASSEYRLILERLRLERENIPELLLEEDPAHRELVEFMIRVNNNLGVSYYQLYRQGGVDAAENLGQGLFHVGRAIELYENAARSPETAVRAERKSQAYNNLRAMIAKDFTDSVSITLDLRRDLSHTLFSKDLMTIPEASPEPVR